ncbi:tail terminator protein [Alteromonas phage vB_AcoS-R7M]|uniref:Tail terminator protein n=1 Tax=Alteromonas phage vB_AcoS-R7M TaxID=2729541 RepID=A0A6M3YR88_9CAUD|nr:tail terminator [Alteromonas phage vB_AcoS-R7M]QJI53354.1 tail terminator protein [Alteromonas phage vB_AcoS-R7M]
MAKHSSILSGLNNALRTFVTSNSYVCGYAETDEPSNKDALWLRAHWLPGNSVAATVGSGGEDNNNGIFQIDVNRPSSSLLSEQMDAVDKITDYFTAGKIIPYNSLSIKVVSSSVTPSRHVGGFRRVSINVRYYVRTTRQL